MLVCLLICYNVALVMMWLGLVPTVLLPGRLRILNFLQWVVDFLRGYNLLRRILLLPIYAIFTDFDLVLGLSLLKFGAI